jgi:hypothetical protein
MSPPETRLSKSRCFGHELRRRHDANTVALSKLSHSGSRIRESCRLAATERIPRPEFRRTKTYASVTSRVVTRPRLTRKLLQCHTLSLGNQQRGKGTKQHEKSKELKQSVQVWCAVGVLAILGGSLADHRDANSVGNDSANLAHSSTDSMSGRAISGREAFARDDERGCVRAGVEKKLPNDVQCEQAPLSQIVVCKTKNAKENCEKKESHNLQWLATEGVDGENRRPVAGKRASTSQDNHPHRLVLELVKKIVASTITDSVEDKGVVES